MRIFLACAAALALGACSGEQSQQAAGCERSVTRNITWSDEAAQDVVTARAEGPSCSQAVVTLVIRKANGDPLWAMATTYFDIVIGDRSDPTPVSDEQIDQFLQNWANVTLNRTGEQPAWAEGADRPGAASGMSYYTELDRDAYEMLRGRNLPQLCYAAGVELSQCLIIDPPTGQPLAFVALGS